MKNAHHTIDLADRLKEAGIVDTHFHVGPELIRRRYDIAELAEAVRPWKATLVVKNHTYPTTPLASFARQHAGVRILGGTVLNRFVGGINPDAVVSARSGNKADVHTDAGHDPTFVVWMPTVHAESHLATLGKSFDPQWGGCAACTPPPSNQPETPVRVFGADGKPVPALVPVLKAIAQAGACLATGHLSANEIMKLVPLALETGVRTVILTHPHYPSVELSDKQLCELTRSDRVFIEHCFAIHTIEKVPLERFVASIDATGPDQVILSTDFGQVHSEPFPDCTVRFASAIRALKPARCSEDDLVSMCTSTPRRALGLVDQS